MLSGDQWVVLVDALVAHRRVRQEVLTPPLQEGWPPVLFKEEGGPLGVLW